MKIPQKIKQKKHENKKSSVVKHKKEHVLVVAQEIKFARLLSSNEKKIRDRALKSLKKWLLNCFDKGYVFKDDDFLRIWKGLFYAVWMSDKPLVQEELCENIASILDIFPPEHYKDALLLVKVGFRAMATEWYGIDQHRMDKCLMLVRRYLRGSLRCVARLKWSDKACKLYTKMLTEGDGILALKTPLYARNATSMILHITDCYLEELSKVSDGEISGESVALLIRPFCEYMCLGENETLCTASRRLLTELLRQSDPGLQYQDKTRAWQQMGCPEGGPDALELDSDDEGEDSDGDVAEDDQTSSGKRLDPRAGRAHVVLAPLPVAAAAVATTLADLRARAPPKAVRRARLTIQRFEALAKNEYPLKVDASSLDFGEKLPKASKAAKTLQALEKNLVSSSDELALRGLSRKHRKRLLARARAGLSIVGDTAPTPAAGEWQVEETTPSKKNKKQDAENKENVKKTKKRKLAQSNQNTSPKKQKTDASKSANVNVKTKKVKSKGDPKAKANENETQSVLKTNVQTTITPKTDKVKKTLKTTQKVKENGDAKNTSPKQKLQKNTSPSFVAKKVKNFQKQLSPKIDKNTSLDTPKKVKFVLKNNSKQDAVDYYKSIRQSPSIPFDSSRQPSKTNLKPSTPSPINPFFKKKWKLTN